jgi:hypothetical protein
VSWKQLATDYLAMIYVKDAEIVRSRAALEQLADAEYWEDTVHAGAPIAFSSIRCFCPVEVVEQIVRNALDPAEAT